MQGGIGDDAAAADVIAAEFELGFDEDKKIGSWNGARDCGGKNFADGDKEIRACRHIQKSAG